MKAKHSEGEVGRKKPIGLLPQLCESRIGLQGWADRAGRPRLPPPTLNTPQLLAEEEEEALIRQRTHTALDMPISTLFKSSIPSMN